MDIFKSFFSNHTTLTKTAIGSSAAGITGAATGAAGATAGLLGFGAGGIGAGTVAAGAMSTAWTTGVGATAVSALQSSGALFMAAVGGSTVAAAAAVAAPIVVGAGAVYAYNRFAGSGSKPITTSVADDPVSSVDEIPPSEIAAMYQSAGSDTPVSQSDCFECSEDEED